MRQDEQAEAALIRMMHTYGGALTGMCTMLLRDCHLAQDIVQETFVKAWRNMGGLRNAASEKAWLCRIAVNLCRDYQRTRWFRLVDRDEEALSRLPAPDNTETSAVLDAIQGLPQRFREVILLHYYQGLEPAETAQVLGLSPSAVYRRLRQARARLKPLLEEDSDE